MLHLTQEFKDNNAFLTPETLAEELVSFSLKQFLLFFGVKTSLFFMVVIK
jgi:hypothetical protein